MESQELGKTAQGKVQRLKQIEIKKIEKLCDTMEGTSLYLYSLWKII